MHLQDLIRRKRDGGKHTADELRHLARGAGDGTHPDDQLAAWLMAAYLRGLDEDEAAALTLAMAAGGERLDLSPLPRPWVDKHSTGGVGDKTTLVALPILAACGLTVVKMSGRGLGITGGTIDKLSAVPGFRLDLAPEAMVAQAARIGLALTGQTPRLAPADGRLYALRDSTCTVASDPLIAASILSKKIAGGAEAVVLDVKAGSGAFAQDPTAARRLAALLERIGTRAGLKVAAVVTDMDQPLGRTAGNTLEVAEAAAILRGDEKGRFRDLCLGLCAEALTLVGQGGLPEATRALDSGNALRKAEAWFEAQGADPRLLTAPDFPPAPIRHELLHSGPAGWVAQWSAKAVGEAVLALGGGRRAKTDTIDPRVGVESHLEVGTEVTPGTRIATLHARTEAEAQEASDLLLAGLRITDQPTPTRPWRIAQPLKPEPQNE